MIDKAPLLIADDLLTKGHAGPEPHEPEPLLVPLERLEERICELAAHLAAGSCRFLQLVAEFDERQGWASWDLPSCAAWLAWKCQVAPATAREQVRVVRALPSLPAITAEFAAGRMSYAKVRALTRIATAATEADLADIAGPMTAAQCERFVAAHRKASDAEDMEGRATRRVSVHVGEDGSVTISAKLPATDGAVVLQALRAAAGDCEHPHRPHRDHAEEAASADGAQRTEDTQSAADAEPAEDGKQRTATCRASLADALVEVAGAYLGGKIAAAGNRDIYQVIVHVGPEALTPGQARATQQNPCQAFPRKRVRPQPRTQTIGRSGQRPSQPAFPRKRQEAHLRTALPGLPADLPIPRTRNAATWTTARPSVTPLRGPSPVTRRCRGCCMTIRATCLMLGGGTVWPLRRCAAPSANATRGDASSRAATRGGPISITSLPGPRAARPGCAT